MRSCHLKLDNAKDQPHPSIGAGKMLFLVICGLFFLRAEAPAQIVNSVDLNLEDKNKSSLIQGILAEQGGMETIPFILEERLFDGGEEVSVSLRVFDILHHFIAVPNISYHFNSKDSLEIPVIDLKFKEPGTHYASWDRLDQQGNKVATGVYFAQLSIESKVEINDAVVENEVTVARRGGVRGFLNKISPGDPFKENVSDALLEGPIESKVEINDAVVENEVTVARRGGVRGFLNKISPGDPFKENVSDPLPTSTYNSVIRIVIN